MKPSLFTVRETQSLRSRLSLLGCCLLACLLAACQAKQGNDPLDTLSEPQPLRVGIAPDAPPLIMMKNGQACGLEREFAGGLARSLKRPLQLVKLPRTELATALMQGRIDIIMSAMSMATAQRHKLATTDAYLISGQVALMHLDDFQRLGKGSTHLSSDAIRLGVISHSPGDTLLTGLHPKGTVHRFPSSLSGLQALIMDRIDVFIHDLPTNNYYAAQFIEQGLTPGVTLLSREPLAWAVQPDNVELREAANDYLAQLKKEGTLETMLSQTVPFYRNTAYSPHLNP